MSETKQFSSVYTYIFGINYKCSNLQVDHVGRRDERRHLLELISEVVPVPSDVRI